MSEPQIISDATIALLRCPVTRSALHRDGEFLVAEVGGLRYPVKDGIPKLLPDEATLPEGYESLDAFRRDHGK